MAVPDKVLGYRLKPYSTQAEYVFNSSGYRGPDFEVPKPSGIYRIICIGGSTTIGSSILENNTYPQILQRKLTPFFSQMGLTVEVINAGVFGYHSWHHLIQIKNEFKGYQPDLYVLMLGLEDLMFSSERPGSELLEAKNMQNEFLTALAAKKQSSLLVAADSLAMHSAFYRLLRVENNQGLPPKQPDESLTLNHPDFDLVVENRLRAFGYFDNFQSLLQEAVAQQTPVLIVNSPFIVPKEDLEAGFAIQRKITPAEFSDDSVLYYVKQKRIGRNVLLQTNKAMAERFSLPVADPQASFDSHYLQSGEIFSYFLDSTQFSPVGNEVIAEDVAKTLTDNWLSLQNWPPPKS